MNTLFDFEEQDARTEEQAQADRDWSIIVELLQPVMDEVATLPLERKVLAINAIRRVIHEESPFKGEPVDLVTWVKNESVKGNSYNPNSVPPIEFQLLKTSISHDGFTQPIVAFPEENQITVVDGFHRHRVGKEDEEIRTRVLGYLPIVQINPSQSDLNNRMASTVRHNRARGKHSVESMSDMVVELKRRFWSDEKIAHELGMESDEVLRLQQITGLAGLFADREFSEAWEAESFTGEEQAEEIDESEEN